MISLYAGTFAVSAIMLVVYFFIDKKRDKYLMMLFCSVALCNLGYFLLSTSKNLDMALWANRIAYAGNVFLPFFLLMMIMNLLKFIYPKFLTRILIAINTAMLFITCSGNILPIYYKDVSFEITNGIGSLIKTYGPLHISYKFYLFAYFGAMVGIIIYTMIKKAASSFKHSVFLAFVVIGNITIWLVENKISSDFEFLAISYIITEGLILLLYGILQDYEKIKEQNNTVIPVITEKADTTNVADDILKDLSEREKEVLQYLLDNVKRKEIAEKLFVTESTIKKHTSNIYKKLEVSNRTELLEKVKIINPEK